MKAQKAQADAEEDVYGIENRAYPVEVLEQDSNRVMDEVEGITGVAQGDETSGAEQAR